MSDRYARSTLAGRVTGWLIVAVVTALAARLVWELLAPLLPIFVCLLITIAMLWLPISRIRRGW
jgi:hypothetical protein